MQPAWVPWQVTRLARTAVAQYHELQTHVGGMQCGWQGDAVVERCGGVPDNSCRATKHSKAFLEVSTLIHAYRIFAAPE